MSKLIEMMVDYYGIKLTDTRAIILQSDLSRYDESLLFAAWEHYRQKDMNGKMPTMAQLVENFPDGRPSAHDAWAMIPRDEIGSVFWTEEMRISYGQVYQIMETEKSNAWFSFKEKYEELTREARMKMIPVKWTPSFGRDHAGRIGAVIEAVEKGRIDFKWARESFPELLEQNDKRLMHGKLNELTKIAEAKRIQ